MPTPAPTSARPDLARGTLHEVVAPSATKPGYLVLAIPGTSYQLHLRHSGEVRTQVGKRLLGVIHAEARRVDRAPAGGRFVEPVFGRPRRIQGTVIDSNGAANTITVDAGGAAIPGVEWGLPIVCKLTDARQKAADFAIGTMVCFDAMDGATITLE